MLTSVYRGTRRSHAILNVPKPHRWWRGVAGWMTLTLALCVTATDARAQTACQMDASGNRIAGQWCTGDVILGLGAQKFEPLVDANGNPLLDPDGNQTWGYVVHDAATYSITDAHRVSVDDIFTGAGSGASTACVVDPQTADLWAAGDRSGLISHFAAPTTSASHQLQTAIDITPAVRTSDCDSWYGQNYGIGCGSVKSMVFDRAGNLYVSTGSGTNRILKLSRTGDLLDSYDVPVAASATWIDLAADQQTMFYTSGDHIVRLFDVRHKPLATHWFDDGVMALSDPVRDPTDRGLFGQIAIRDWSGVPMEGTAFHGMRILPPGDGHGDLLVAYQLYVLRIDLGGHLRGYLSPDNDFQPIGAFELTPDARSLWIASVQDDRWTRSAATTKVHIPTNIADILPATVPAHPALGGLCINGGYRASVTQPDCSALPGDPLCRPLPICPGGSSADDCVPPGMPMLTQPPDQDNSEGDTIEPVTIIASDPNGLDLIWEVTSLPDGVTFNPTTRQISGTVSYVASDTIGLPFTTVRVRVHNARNLYATRDFRWTIHNVNQPPTVAITPTLPQDNQARYLISTPHGVPFGQINLAGTDIDPCDGVGFYPGNGESLPAGISLDVADVSNPACTRNFVFPAMLSGTPTTDGQTTFTLYSPSYPLATFVWTVFNIAPTLASVSDQITALGASITIPVAATDANGDSLTFSASGLPPGITIDPSSGTITGAATRAGRYTVTATVRDEFGGTASATFSLVVNGPDVSITTPHDGDSIPPSVLTIVADVGSGNESLARVDFMANDVVIGSATASPYQFVWLSPSIGPVSLTAVAVDEHGWTVQSSPVAVTITAPSACSPVLAPGAMTRFAAASSGVISVTAPSDCAWTATVDRDWLQLAPSSGTGSTVIAVTLAANVDPAPRTATVDVNGATVAITQVANQPTRPTFGYRVAVGAHHSLVLKNDGTVWSWGNNDFGQLGNGSFTGSPIAHPVTLNDVVAIAAGDAHSVALTSDGTVWAWGDNSAGQIGDGTYGVTHETPEPVAGLSNVIAIAAGSSHSLALQADGTVWAWGANDVGQLGDGTAVGQFTPVRVMTLTEPVVSVAAAGMHTVVTDATGAVWAFGLGGGRTGDGEANNTYVPLRSDPLPSIAAVAATSAASFAVTRDGHWWEWGQNASGQLGDGATLVQLSPEALNAVPSFTKIVGGPSHTVALDADGRVWSWGSARRGQLGNGAPTCPPDDTTCTASIETRPVVIAGPTGVVDVAVNGNNTLAISQSGELWGWGENDFGQVGDGYYWPGDSRVPCVRSQPIQVADAGLAWHTASPACGGTTIIYDDYDFAARSLTPGAVVRYTTDGSDPTIHSPILNGALHVDQRTTVKMQAQASGMPPSAIEMVVFDARAWPPDIEPQCCSFSAPQRVTMTTLGSAQIRYTLDGSDPTAASTVYTEPFTIGTHTVVKAIAIRPGWTTSDLSQVTLTFDLGRLPAPMATPASGAYLYGQTIALSTSGGTIHYTTDGTAPTQASAVYSSPLSLVGAMTLKAVAFDPDYEPSPVATASYAAKATAPVFSPGGGAYNPTQSITITDSTPGVAIHYSTNGVDPTVNDPVVPSGGTRHVGNFTLKARAFSAGFTPSDVVSAVYSRTDSACRLTLSPPVVVAGAEATGGIIAIAATDDSCAWSATSDSSWLAADPSTGSGVAGRVVYHVAPNPTPTLRTGLIEIGDEAVLVIQSGQPACLFTLAPGAIVATAAGGSDQLHIGASDGGCAWAAVSAVPWLRTSVTDDVSAYAQAVLGDHATAFWRFGDAPGSAGAADISGFGHDGTATAVGFGAAGPMVDGRTAAAFDGVASTMVIPHDASFDNTASWDAWIMVAAPSANRRHIVGNGTGVDTWSLWIEPSSTHASINFRTSEGGYQSVTTAATIVGAGWTHVAFTYDATAGWHVYVNGVEDAAGAASGTMTPTGNPMLIGRDELQQSWYDGGLADLALYPYALSLDQVAHHFSARLLTGLGSGSLTYDLDANSAADIRTSSLPLAGTTVAIAQAAAGGVAIAGAVSPLPQASGWNTTEVTVTFVCAGEGTITCPDPVTVFQDGEQDITGTATNDSGATATTSVHIKIDKTAPVIAVTSAPSNVLVSPGALTLTGSVGDAQAGVVVTCNGQAATLDSDIGTFACTIVVGSGTTPILIEARDALGNIRRFGSSVTTTDAAIAATPPTAIHVSPQNVTMVVGDTHRFSVMDDQGRIPRDATWTVDSPSIAALSVDTDVVLTALAAGNVTLTASWQGLTATTHVTIYATGTTMSSGTVLWSGSPLSPDVGHGALVPGSVAADGSQLVFTSEVSAAWGTPDRLRAFDQEGRERWVADTGGRIAQMSGDPGGGVVVLVNPFASDPNALATLKAYDASGALVAAYALPSSDVRLNQFGNPHQFAIHPSGVLYAVDAAGLDLVGFDIGYGAGPRVRFGFGDGNDVIQTETTDGSALVRLEYPTGIGYAGPPTIMPDGTVRIEYATVYDRTSDFWFGNELWCHGTLTSLTIDPAGVVHRTLVADNRGRPEDTHIYFGCPVPTKVIPLGDGWYSNGSSEWNEATGEGNEFIFWGTTLFGPPTNIAVLEDHTIMMATEQGDPAGPALGAMDTSGHMTTMQPSHGFITSMFAVAGGLVAAYEDGTVTGPDDGFANLNLSDIAPAGDARYFGYSAAGAAATTSTASPVNFRPESTVTAPQSFVLVGGPSVGRSMSRWQATLGGGANAASARPLTTGDLKKLAEREGIGLNQHGIQYNRAVGLAFQGASMCSLGPQGFVTNTRFFFSSDRDAETGHAVQNVVPDSVRPVLVKTLPTGEWRNLDDSSFFEVKAVNGTISLDSNNKQAVGLIDVAANSPLANAVVDSWPLPSLPPLLTFITTADTTISGDVLVRGNVKGVLVRQIVAEEVAGYISLPSARLLNATFLQRLFIRPSIPGRACTLRSRPGVNPVGDPDPSEIQ